MTWVCNAHFHGFSLGALCSLLESSRARKGAPPRCLALFLVACGQKQSRNLDSGSSKKTKSPQVGKVGIWPPRKPEIGNDVTPPAMGGLAQ